LASGLRGPVGAGASDRGGPGARSGGAPHSQALAEAVRELRRWLRGEGPARSRPVLDIATVRVCGVLVFLVVSLPCTRRTREVACPECAVLVSTPVPQRNGSAIREHLVRGPARATPGRGRGVADRADSARAVSRWAEESARPTANSQDVRLQRRAQALELRPLEGHFYVERSHDSGMRGPRLEIASFQFLGSDRAAQRVGSARVAYAQHVEARGDPGGLRYRVTTPGKHAKVLKRGSSRTEN
jgi:hypothetical protein